MENAYIPFSSVIQAIIPHTAAESTFRMTYDGPVKPGQFFEVSLPKYGEAPISVSGSGENYVDLTIRKVGKVTDEVFKHQAGDSLFLRGPYGNGFDIDLFKYKELIIAAGGTGLSPVKGLADYFAAHPGQVKNCTVLAGFKTPDDILFKDSLAKWRETMDVIVTVDCVGPERRDYTGKVGLPTALIPELPIENPAAAQVVVVGPPVMMKFTTQAFLQRGIPEQNIWISQERKMCCGIGKCGHCRIGSTYVCLNGPVFNYTQGKLLQD